MGNSYRIDTKYDRYMNLEVSKRLAREASKRGFGCHVTYSAMTRGYCCEIRKYESKFRSQTSTHIYYFTEGHKYGPDPLTAMVRAMRQCVPYDLLLAVLYLEAEAELLKIDYGDRAALEKRLDKALDDLQAIIDQFGHRFAEIAELRASAVSVGELHIGGRAYPAKMWITDEEDAYPDPVGRELPDLRRGTFTVDEIKKEHFEAMMIQVKPKAKPLPDDIDDDL